MISCVGGGTFHLNIGFQKKKFFFSFFTVEHGARKIQKKNETNKQPYLQTTTTKSNGIQYFTNQVYAEDKHVRVKF